MKKIGQSTSQGTKSLYEAPMSDEEYGEWFKEFVEGWRCRICKTDLTLDNFGGTGENHMIFCKDCK